MRHEIIKVSHGSVAEHFGIKPRDTLLAINGEKIIDEIDYQALIASKKLDIELEREDGTQETVVIRKREDVPLGLHFGESMTLSPRRCHNKCVFCFIDQMPKGLRDTLYVKDDDWRYSLMMGNFVTLTNVDDAEFERILRRKPSPLYVSVHATNPELRVRMMNNRTAGGILDKLKRLAEAGIRFHCQIVLCPGYNDGAELMRTLNDLKALAPAAVSAAIVPVGLTRFREGLAELKPFDSKGAGTVLDMLEPFQRECKKELGTSFAFPSDEFFCLSGREIPPEEWYEGYPQIENGVGLLRLLESDMEEAERFDDEPEFAPSKTYIIPTGVSAAPHIARLCERFKPDGVSVRVIPVENRFFGSTVSVTGLLTGGDVLNALAENDVRGADEILLCSVMLRHEGDLFLDDMTIGAFRERAPLPVRLTGGDGQALYDALRGRGGEE